MDFARTPPASSSEAASKVCSFISQNISADDDAAFNQLALEIFARQFETIPIYRSFCERRGVTPGKVGLWTGIPALPASAFKEHAVSSLAENDRPYVFHSSGTTAQLPSRHFHNATSMALYELSLLTWFERNFTSPAQQNFIFLTPPPAEAPNSSLVHMFETIRKKMGGAHSVFVGKTNAEGAWMLEFDKLDAALAKDFPTGILGTAFSFVHWLDYLAAQNRRLRLPAVSTVLETGGYKGRSRTVPKAELRATLKKYLTLTDAQIITEYGMSELSSQAYAGASGLFRFPPWARVEVISAETGVVAPEGEPGLLRVVDLANVFSVSALQTGDLAITRGQEFELLGRPETVEPRGCSYMVQN